jgi:transcriptional regulator with XRE-family HTH domain
LEKNMKNTKRRTTTQIERDRRRISELYLQGKTQAEIADVVGLSQSTVSLDLKALNSLWLAAALVDLDTVKARSLAEIYQLEITYWEAWQASGKRAPDAKFLAGVQWCIEQRLKMFGVYEAGKVKVDLTTGDSGPVEFNYSRFIAAAAGVQI